MTKSKKIREVLGISRAEFSRRYNIPIRTLEDWDAGVSNPPAYVLALLERVVLEDKRYEAFGCNWLGDHYLFPDGDWTVVEFDGDFLVLENVVAAEPKRITIKELASLFAEGIIKI